MIKHKYKIQHINNDFKKHITTTRNMSIICHVPKLNEIENIAKRHEKILQDDYSEDTICSTSQIDELCEMFSQVIIQTEKQNPKTYKNLRINTAYDIRDLTFGMSIISARDNVNVINHIVKYTVDTIYLFPDIKGWCAEINNIKFYLDINPRLVKAIGAMSIHVLIDDKRYKVSRDSILKKIKKIIYDVGVNVWLQKKEDGKYSGIKNLIKTNAMIYKAVYKGIRMVAPINISCLKDFMERRGKDPVLNALWIVNNLGENFENIALHPYVQEFISNIFSKIEHYTQRSFEYLTEVREEPIQCYLSPVGIILVQISDRNSISEKIINTLKENQQKYYLENEIDVSSFDNDMSQLTAFYLNYNFERICYNVREDYLRATSLTIYGSDLYPLHALQIIVNHVLCKTIEANMNTDEVISDYKIFETIYASHDISRIYILYWQQLVTKHILLEDGLKQWIAKKSAKHK